MDVNFINPFIESTINVLSTMAMVQPQPGKPFLKQENKPTGDLTGVIGLAGPQVTGSMAILFSESAVLNIVSKMLGEQYDSLGQDVVDCVGELTNMISGGAKARLWELGYQFEMAIPSMIKGKAHHVYHKTNGPVIVIPFNTEAGEFYIEACFVKL